MGCPLEECRDCSQVAVVAVLSSAGASILASRAGLLGAVTSTSGVLGGVALATGLSIRPTGARAVLGLDSGAGAGGSGVPLVVGAGSGLSIGVGVGVWIGVTGFWDSRVGVTGLEDSRVGVTGLGSSGAGVTSLAGSGVDGWGAVGLETGVRGGVGLGDTGLGDTAIGVLAGSGVFNSGVFGSGVLKSGVLVGSGVFNSGVFGSGVLKSGVLAGSGVLAMGLGACLETGLGIGLSLVSTGLVMVNFGSGAGSEIFFISGTGLGLVTRGGLGLVSGTKATLSVSASDSGIWSGTSVSVSNGRPVVLNSTPESLVSRLPPATSLDDTSRPCGQHTEVRGERSG